MNRRPARITAPRTGPFAAYALGATGLLLLTLAIRGDGLWPTLAVGIPTYVAVTLVWWLVLDSVPEWVLRIARKRHARSAHRYVITAIGCLQVGLAAFLGDGVLPIVAIAVPSCAGVMLAWRPTRGTAAGETAT